MRNSIQVSNFFGKVAATCLLSMTFALGYGQEQEKKDSVTVQPAEIYAILKPACMTCHSDQGRDKPRNAVNFTAWGKYTDMERKMLAGSIREELVKGSMPPKMYLKNHPEAALTEEQLKQLVQWCESLK